MSVENSRAISFVIIVASPSYERKIPFEFIDNLMRLFVRSYKISLPLFYAMRHSDSRDTSLPQTFLAYVCGAMDSQVFFYYYYYYYY